VVAEIASMSAFRWVNCRRTAVVAVLAAAALAMPSTLRTALADDWQQCLAHQPDELLAACSAVIDQGGTVESLRMTVAIGGEIPDPTDEQAVHRRKGENSADAELARAHAIRGEWYRVRNRNDEAMADFKEAEKLDPKSYAAITGLGATLAQKGQFADALADDERAIALNPQLPYGYLLRALLRQRQNQFSEAMADFDHAISLRGDVPIYYVRRGTLLNQTGDPDRALADLDRAIALNPDLAEAFFIRGTIYRTKGNLDRAITELTRAIAIAPKNANSYSVRGDLFSSKGDLDRAIADYDQALAIAPENKTIEQRRQAAASSKTEIAKVAGPRPLPWWATVAPTAPKSAPSAQPSLAPATALFQRRRFDDAIAALNPIIAANPGFGAAYSLRAFSWLQKRQFSEALADFNESLKREPRNANFLVGRATITW
jgi:tetratricopeptide (TPR) repeat protein